ATHEMRMIVDHARNNGLAPQVHPPGTGPGEFRYVRIRADGDEPAAFHGHGLYDRETLIHRDDLAVRQDQIRRRLLRANDDRSARDQHQHKDNLVPTNISHGSSSQSNIPLLAEEGWMRH